MSRKQRLQVNTLSAQGDETSTNQELGNWARMDDLFGGSSMGKGSEVRKCRSCEEIKHHSVWLDHGNHGDGESGT